MKYIKCQYCKKKVVKDFKEYTDHINGHGENVKMALFTYNLINMIKKNGA